MVVEVVPRLGHKVSRALSGSSIAGNGMLVRLRSSTLAILGLVAAVGLGLVAFASLQGWPGVLSGPLPQEPGPDFLRNDAIVAPPFGGLGTAAPRSRLASRPARPGGRPGNAQAGGTSALTGARQVESASSQPQPQPQPVSTPAPSSSSPGSTAEQPQPAPAAVTPTIEPASANARPSGGDDGSAPIAADSDESPSSWGEGRRGRHSGWGSDRDRSWDGDNRGSDWDRDDHSGGGDRDDHGDWGHDDHDDWDRDNRDDDHGRDGHGGSWGRH